MSAATQASEPTWRDEPLDVEFEAEPQVARQPRRRFLSRPRQRPVREPAPFAEDTYPDLYAEPIIEEGADPGGDMEGRSSSAFGESYGNDAPEPSGDAFGASAVAAEPIVEPPRNRLGRGRRQYGADPAGRIVVDHAMDQRDFVRSHGIADVERDAAEDVVYDADLLHGVLDEFEPDIPVEDFVVAPGAIEDEIEAEPQLWSAIPRMCRTCRDFRPAEHGERGWCTNKWAFSHRRMVDADELPCETSIGGWWLPHDETWMTGVDVSAHSQPTPLLDQWLAHRAATSGEFDATPPLRRRQRS